MEYPEGTHSKVGNGWVKKGDMSDFEWFEFLADNGHSYYQNLLSALIIASDTYVDRQVHAFKWAFLASVLDRESWGRSLDFLYAGLTPDQIDRGYLLVDSWVGDKCEDEFEQDKTGWSSELKEFMESPSKS